MDVEMSGIRDGKGDGGILRFTLRDDAVIRWTLTRSVVGEYARNMNLRCGLHTDDTYDFVHEQNLPSPLKRDEKDVLTVMKHISHRMTNPFDTIDCQPHFLNISNGIVASSEVEKLLLNSYEIGEKMLQNFLHNRFDSNRENRISSYDVIKKSSIKTFTDMEKKVVIKRSDEDDSKRTGTKSDLLHIIEKKVEENTVKDLDLVSQPACIIVDIMADIQSLNTKYMASFDDIGKYFVNAFEKLLQRYVEVHLIFDRYDDTINPKDLERSERYEQRFHHYDISASRPIPDWNKILSSDENKKSLILFLCRYIEEKLVIVENANHPRKVYSSGGYEDRLITQEITSSGSSAFQELFCNHTEADTRIIPHLMKIGNEYPNSQVIVKSLETDVFILLIGHSRKMPTSIKLWFYTGKVTLKADLRRYIPIHTISDALGDELISALLSVHALSGCDTTAYFF
ncbi:hypothetical protein QAD02_013055 [Eretmocerus hayati]|uniref:Uncharacterized protein n=1 Tax=Eretmocerus hayati TaxID=131215 RepID=A0ACC2P2D4_9HYME|nr:hypothetical protein QAD02_013055 [Eretmocerus hayati]